MFGSSGFDQSQQEYCECIPSTSVLPHYTQLITDFYEQYISDPAARKTGAEIIGKHKFGRNTGTEQSPRYSKMDRLYYELHKKYDNAIKHIDGRRGRDPPRPHASSGKGPEL